MSSQSRSLVLRKAVIAAILGASGGVAGGLLSLHHEVPKVTSVGAAAAPVRREAHPVASVLAPAPVATKGVGVPTPARTSAISGAVAAPQSRAAREESVDPLQRARALALRPDVKALVALRESVVRRAQERGEAASEASKRQLDELDRYLGEARALRLKLDAEEFRKSTGAANRPR
jgi:hypothetical protein